MTNTKRKWLVYSLVGIGIILISLLAYCIYLYQVINDSRTSEMDTTTTQLLQQTSYVDIHSIESFHGTNSYHVLEATNEAGEDKLVFYPLEGEQRQLKVFDMEDMLSKDTLIESWQSSCDSCKLVNVTPALMEEEAYWEITYHDNENNYVMNYHSITDGSLQEQYKYPKMFN
ncbi:DUF5590 domain-containing protein [Oceanobacillus sp. 1P07AA]|uniref:cell wall elongation regulator TseB-like domain-containing protein n=1 Tax=Oceanobacillus sp. 1P07AA TaxID=3132293 RepID=UPI0039A4868E